MTLRRGRRFACLIAMPIAAFIAFDDAFAAGGSTLSTPGQIEREVRALEVLGRAPMRDAIDALEQAYREDTRGKTASGAATARRAAESTAAAAACTVVNDDPGRPVVFWGANAPHRWFGISLPRAGYGIENPDNTYRHLHVDGASRYEIRGRFPKSGPVELHFVVMDAVPGSKKQMPVEGGEMIATLRSDAMQIATDGSFTITIDSDPANGRPNHIQIPSTGHFPVHVRDLFTDWSRQDPVALEVTRVAGPAPSPLPSIEVQAERAAARLAQMGPFWLAYNNQYLYTLPPNTIATPRSRPGGRGLSVAGHFALAEDEALVITLDALGAGSLGVQLADPWGVSYEYIDRTSSLNQTQASANADGTFTYVISARDPGVHNWLDPDGGTSGILVARWQVLPKEVDPQKAVRRVEVMKVAALRNALPTGTHIVTTKEREIQRAERARQYARRLGQ